MPMPNHHALASPPMPQMSFGSRSSSILKSVEFSRGGQSIRGRTLQRFGRAHELWLATMSSRGLRSETRMNHSTFCDAIRSADPALPREELGRLWSAAGGTSTKTTISYWGFRRALDTEV